MSIDISKLNIDEILAKKEEVSNQISIFRKQLRELREFYNKKTVEIEKAIEEMQKSKAVDLPTTKEDMVQLVDNSVEEVSKEEPEGIVDIIANQDLNTSQSQGSETYPYIDSSSVAKQDRQSKLDTQEKDSFPGAKQASQGGKYKSTSKRGKSSGDDGFEESRASKKRQNFNANIDAFYDDEETKIIKVRKPKRGQSEGFNITEKIIIEHAILDKAIVTVKELADKIGKSGNDILKKLHSIDIIKTINERIDFATAELVASEFGINIELQEAKTSEDIINEIHLKDEGDEDELMQRPPVVTIMGHVDHGKTSLLDYIRKEHVASGEAGGITQHIGAYSVKVGKNSITFIDTPGHAAFTQMRERGAKVTDIVIIVVAADDGVMPQTIEAINHSKIAEANIIVAINKIDKKNSDIDRILDQLSRLDILAEEWGGNIPIVKVSAKTGEGVDLLLNTLLAASELMELKANPSRKGRGIVLETRLDSGKGPIATVIVQNGTLKVGDFIVAGNVTGKIRAMHDDQGFSVNKAGPSNAVAILGLKELPNAGDNLLAVDNEKLAKQVASDRIAKEKDRIANRKQQALTELYKNLKEGEEASLNLIIKGDVQGSVEALSDSLENLSNKEVKVNIIQAVPGSINESDVSLARTTNSVIIGFNVRPDTKAKNLADSLQIDIKLYRIIYDAIEDVQNALKGLLKPIFREEYLGRAEVRKVYKIPGLGNIAGCMVKDGKIIRSANVRLIRDNIIIADSMISSLKRFEDDAREVASGYECGIGLKAFNDFIDGDIIESFRLVEG